MRIPDGRIYVSCFGNHRVRVLVPPGGDPNAWQLPWRQATSNTRKVSSDGKGAIRRLLGALTTPVKSYRSIRRVVGGN